MIDLRYDRTRTSLPSVIQALKDFDEGITTDGVLQLTAWERDHYRTFRERNGEEVFPWKRKTRTHDIMGYREPRHSTAELPIMVDDDQALDVTNSSQAALPPPEFDLFTCGHPKERGQNFCGFCPVESPCECGYLFSNPAFVFCPNCGRSRSKKSRLSPTPPTRPMSLWQFPPSDRSPLYGSTAYNQPTQPTQMTSSENAFGISFTDYFNQSETGRQNFIR